MPLTLDQAFEKLQEFRADGNFSKEDLFELAKQIDVKDVEGNITVLYTGTIDSSGVGPYISQSVKHMPVSVLRFATNSPLECTIFCRSAGEAYEESVKCKACPPVRPAPQSGA